jgi:hypothetical protein
VLLFETLEERTVLSGTIVDHNDLAVVQALPDSALTAVADQRWFFSHASVGGNMGSGMSDLHGMNATRYAFTLSNVSYNSGELRAANPPASTAPGTIYDCNRGNPGWESKLTIFRNSLNVSGWHDTKVDVVMDKFCYIDQAASATSYLDTMSTLEAAYPATRFVYITMPLTTGSDSNNVLRNNYNNAVRAHCVANGKLLLDLADIEAYTPTGVASTFVYSSQTYQKLYDGYSTDGGHLNDAANVGRQRAALGWYAMAALIEGTLGTPTGLSLSNAAVAENSPAAPVGSFSTTDRDPADTFTYTLVPGGGSDDNARFTIVDGQLQTKEALDFETQSTCHVRVRTTDGEGLQYEQAFTINVTDANDAPTLDSSGSLLLPPIDEDDAGNSGTLVSQILASAGGTPIADVDAGAVQGIAVTAVDNAHGAWQYQLGTAGVWTDLGSPSTTSAVLLPANDPTAIRFLPDADWNGVLDAAITFVAWDQTSGEAGVTADASTRGDTAAFSSDEETATIAVNAVADAPRVVAPLADVTVDEDSASTQIDLATVFADPDAGDALSYTVSPTTVVDLVGEVTEANYTHILQDLLYTHTGDNRGYGVQHDLARNNIQSYFESLGLTTTLEAFTYSSATYYNVVATKTGTTRPNDVYVVGAHYDSVNNPGADDNASGTAAVMEIARVLSSYEFDATLRFVAFDREEQGLKGSYAYVAAHSSDHILGMVNLDMIAYNPIGSSYNTVALFDRVSGGSMKPNLAAAIASYAPGITSVDAGQIWGSDHSPFEEAGFDAALIIEYNHSSNPNYHRATDAVETAGYLDYTYATQLTRAAAGYLASAAGLNQATGLLTPHFDGFMLTLDYGANQYGDFDVTVRAIDSLGAWAENTFHLTVVSINDPPVVATLTDSPDPVDPGQNVVLTAGGVADPLDPAGSVASVAFYRESNGIPGLQPGEGGDTPLGVDSDSADGWSLSVSTAGLSGDTYTYYARATDNEGLASPSGVDAPATTNTLRATLDADGNGTADALTDGILILRYLFDPAGPWNYSDALGSGATRTTREAIRNYLDDASTTLLDCDGNSSPDALTDGILILRYLFDRAGAWNYSDALGSGATRTDREAIRTYLDQYNPSLGGGQPAELFVEMSSEAVVGTAAVVDSPASNSLAVAAEAFDGEPAAVDAPLAQADNSAGATEACVPQVETTKSVSASESAIPRVGLWYGYRKPVARIAWLAGDGQFDRIPSRSALRAMDALLSTGDWRPGDDRYEWFPVG